MAFTPRHFLPEIVRQTLLQLAAEGLVGAYRSPGSSDQAASGWNLWFNNPAGDGPLPLGELVNLADLLAETGY